MNKLKQLMEKLGAVRKKLNQFTNDRASKVTEMIALSEKEELTDEEQTQFNNLKSEIDGIDKKMEAQQTVADNLQSQITQERVNGDQPEGSTGFQFNDTGGDPTPEEKEAGQYRFVKAFREASDPQTAGLSGLEKEMHQEAIKDNKERGIKAEGNLLVPQAVMDAPSAFNRVMGASKMQKIKNDLTVDGGTGGNQGGLTVDTTLMSLIDILKAKLVFTGENGLGATFFNDLDGDVEFPKAIEDSDDPATKSETGESDEQSPTFGSLELSPTRLPTFTEVTRKLLMQSSVAIEVWLRNYLMYKLKKKMEKDIINAILDNANIGAVVNGTNGDALTWAKVVEFETIISNADADEPSMGWLTNPYVRGELKTTEKTSGNGHYIWNETTNLVNSAPAMVSTLVPGDLAKGTSTNLSAALFGNWASLYIGQWGGFGFLVNPFSRDTEGIIRINSWTFFDSGLRHPESFAASKDIQTANSVVA